MEVGKTGQWRASGAESMMCILHHQHSMASGTAGKGRHSSFRKTLVSNQFCTRGTALPCPYIAIVAEEVRQPGVAALKIAVATRAKQSTRLAVVKDSLTAAESNTTPATNPPTTAPALSHDGSIARLSAWMPCYVQYFSICKRRGKML